MIVPAAWAAPITAALLALAPPGAGVGAAQPLALSADFVLRLSSGGAAGDSDAAVTGHLRMIPGGEVCVTVTAPLAQQMRLSARELVILYPDRDLALVTPLAPRQAPPMLDAIAAGVVDPGSTLPVKSRLVDQRHADGKLFTRWRVVDGSDQDLGEMRAVETREGTLLLR
jgi:hypothetical protein